MKIYCYCFKMDGTVEKKKMICRKNKQDYAFKYERGDYEFITHIPFEKIGVVLGEDSTEEGVVHGFRMYLEDDKEVTREMVEFSRFRAQKLNQLLEFKKKIEGEIGELKEKIEREI